MEPDAPTRFSGMKVALPRYFAAYCASRRPERSESPPAPNGITNEIGLEGYCALALVKMPSKTINANHGFIPHSGILLWMVKPSMPPGPVSGPGVWYGRDLQPHTDWIRNFSAAELAELDAAVRAFKALGTPLAEISPATFQLPSLGIALAGILSEILEGR